jgi:SAM-dependent methyltransferase
MTTQTSLQAPPTPQQLNVELENFKDRRFTEAQVVNARRDLERFDGQNIETFRVGLDLVDESPLDGFSLLDVGCGIGLYSTLFARYGRKRIDYSGCDFSQAMVDAAVAQNPDRPFTRADARLVPFGDKSFDVVWISALLEHVPECDQILAEAARVARHSILLHRLFLHDGPDAAQIISCKATEYPFIDGFTYPRTLRNRANFDRFLEERGTITTRRPWAFDKKRQNSPLMHSYAVRLAA